MPLFRTKQRHVGAELLDRRQGSFENGKIRLRTAAVETRTFCESSSLGDANALRCARRPARKRKKTDDGTSSVRLPATVAPRCDGAMPGQQP
jgi:hypothetical protein